jgi:hypothetical protein
MPFARMRAYSFPMNRSGKNHIGRTIPTTPGHDRVGPGLTRRPPEQTAPTKAQRSVMDRLLGNNDLAAFDPSNNDPYNASGRRIRR